MEEQASNNEEVLKAISEQKEAIKGFIMSQQDEKLPTVIPGTAKIDEDIITQEQFLAAINDSLDKKEQENLESLENNNVLKTDESKAQDSEELTQEQKDLVHNEYGKILNFKADTEQEKEYVSQMEKGLYDVLVSKNNEEAIKLQNKKEVSKKQPENVISTQPKQEVAKAEPELIKPSENKITNTVYNSTEKENNRPEIENQNINTNAVQSKNNIEEPDNIKKENNINLNISTEKDKNTDTAKNNLENNISLPSQKLDTPKEEPVKVESISNIPKQEQDIKISPDTRADNKPVASQDNIVVSEKGKKLDNTGEENFSNNIKNESIASKTNVEEKNIPINKLSNNNVPAEDTKSETTAFKSSSFSENSLDELNKNIIGLTGSVNNILNLLSNATNILANIASKDNSVTTINNVAGSSSSSPKQYQMISSNIESYRQSFRTPNDINDILGKSLTPNIPGAIYG